MEIFNLNQLVKAVVSKKQLSLDYVYQHGRKKSLFKKEIKPGFIRLFHWNYGVDRRVFSKEDLEQRELIIEGEKVFEMPILKLYFSNSQEYQHYEVFHTDEEAIKRAKEICKNIENKIVYGN